MVVLTNVLPSKEWGMCKQDCSRVKRCLKANPTDAISVLSAIHISW
jgi:hypothetical protein